jgi:cysteinyl-tRNA synthetase
MSLRVYNTLTKQKDLFEPVRPGKVGIYVCGVTVYKSPHIGHMVGPVIFDAIKRYLTFKGYEVTLVVNITDVDDKIIDRAQKANTSVQAVAEQYTKEYLEALSGFGVDTIDKFPKASEHMADIIELTERLIEQGHAYAAEGNVYFDVTSDPDYGKLSNRKVEEQEAGTRAVEGAGKKNPADFALWKAVKPGEPAWESPWGKGRPGWHIECSAMSMKYLGPTFDMHGGGMDLMFPHHENELAQSESATGQPFVRFWMHNGLTRIKTKASGGELKLEKASGSLIATGQQEAATVDARALLEKHGAELLRYMLLSTHYRRPIEFTDEVMVAAKKGLSVFHRLFERIERLNNAPLGDDTQDMDRTAAGLLEGENAHFARSILGLKMKFLEMMDDDFNTAGAIAVLHEIAGETNAFIERHNIEVNKQPDLMQAVTAAAQTLRKLGLVLGLFRAGPSKDKGQDKGLVDGLMALLIKLRADARAAKNFAIADGVRDGLAQIGVTLEDRADGTIWRKA